MIVYHGSSVMVKRPDVLHSHSRLDFGTGFYVTSNHAQAERWAMRKARTEGQEQGNINEYDFSEDSTFVIMDFKEDLENWIDFVCACRNGSNIYARYDIIKGKVADDKVFRVVDMYKRGIWDKDRAIREMLAYEYYDQIAFITQPAIDSMLTFMKCTEIPL